MKPALRMGIGVVAFLPLSGCCTFRHCLTPDQEVHQRFARLEQKMAEFSKQVNAYNAQHPEIASTFDTAKFFAALDAAYPSGRNHDAVNDLRSNYMVKVRSIPGGYYSAVVCEEANGRKLLEDLSCKPSGVEIRLWDKLGSQPCDFVPDAGPYCR